MRLFGVAVPKPLRMAGSEGAKEESCWGKEMYKEPSASTLCFFHMM